MRTAALSCLALISLAPRADGYVRSRTPSGTPTYWPSSCVFVQPDAAGTPDIPAADFFAAVNRSTSAWSSRTSCGFVQLQDDKPAAGEAHFDGVNLVKFRRDHWCHPEHAQSHDVCYDAQAAGITTVFYADHPGKSDDGQILDADVELNNINFTFAILVDGTNPPTPKEGTLLADLENTLVHELGHLQGLDHTCSDSATPATARDENGNVPPSCSQLNSLSATERAKITEATMFNFAVPAETKKRTPESDDVAGICAAYPLASDPRSCRRADLAPYFGDKGCAMATGAASRRGLQLLPLLYCFALLGLRRRQPR
jgi:hypothetical protein